MMKGHYAALLTITIWGTTFVSTKVLLNEFLPIEILFSRFLVGYIALFLISRHAISFHSWKEEGLFAAAGLTGVCLYYLLENIALTYTLASNVGVIVSAAPLFTAILSLVLKRNERAGGRFYIGFAMAIAGILLISMNGSSMDINPKGDVLALLAAFIWAIYSLLSKRISTLGYDVVRTTRRTFFYGLLFMLPILLLSDATMALERFGDARNILNMLYLGFGASALCFVTWNYAVSKLGAVATSSYIYLVPVITIIFSAIFLSEPVTLMMAAGTVLTLGGLALSQKK